MPLLQEQVTTYLQRILNEKFIHKLMCIVRQVRTNCSMTQRKTSTENIAKVYIATDSNDLVHKKVHRSSMSLNLEAKGVSRFKDI